MLDFQYLLNEIITLWYNLRLRCIWINLASIKLLLLLLFTKAWIQTSTECCWRQSTLLSRRQIVRVIV